MYYVGIILFVAFLAGSTLLSGPLATFIDFPSILIILAFSLPMLMASGLFPDFFRSFRIMGQRTNTYSCYEIRKTEISLGLTIKLLLFSGLAGFLIGLIAILSGIRDMAYLAPGLAVATLTPFYAVILVFILLPVQAKVRAVLLTMDKEYLYEEDSR